MHRPRLVLALATGLSLLLHLVVLGGDRVALPILALPDDDIVASRPASAVPRVRLLPAASPLPSTAPAATADPVAAPAAGPGDRAGPARLPSPEEGQAPGTTAPPVAAAPVAPAGDAGAAATAEPRMTPAEPAPAFPVQLSAQLEARLGHREGLLRQTWQMEGLRYAIDVRAERPALAMQLGSEGTVHPEGGLTPARSALMVGKRLRSQTDYVAGRITLGAPDRRQSHPLPVVPQDLASLPFHLAVTFSGQPQTLFVSSGTALHQIRFALVAEETLRLPAGTVRTLHLAGEQFHLGLRQMVRAYDVWLAPDFLNFPVKVKGHLPDGTPFDYRVLTLDIEGRRVLGPLLTQPSLPMEANAGIGAPAQQ